MVGNSGEMIIFAGESYSQTNNTTMRKMMITLAMFVMGLTVAVAQDDVYGAGKKDEGKKDVKTNTPVTLTDNGAYEQQKVVTVEG